MAEPRQPPFKGFFLPERFLPPFFAARRLPARFLPVRLPTFLVRFFSLRLAAFLRRVFFETTLGYSLVAAPLPHQFNDTILGLLTGRKKRPRGFVVHNFRRNALRMLAMLAIDK
jgi:hypothetical protein